MYPMEQAVQDILLHARQEALDMFNSYIGTEHVLLAMCSRKESYLNQLLANGKVPYLQLKKDLEILFSYPKSLNQPMDYTDTMFDVLRMGNDTRIEDGRSCMNEEDLTVALFQVEKSLASEVLRRYGIDIQSHFQVENHILELDELPELTNLNAKMEHSKCVIFEREKELQMIVEVLLRKEKANPLLLGDAGVGKSAIVEALAKRLANQEVPFLHQQIIYELNINGIVAGTKYRGEFEEKIQKLLGVVKKYPQVILFIDEIHHILGAGKAEGSLDVAGVMKPYLARKEIRCIGATTFIEYEQQFEKDPAMQRRFQSIPILEFTVEQMLELMKGKCKEYSEYHGVDIKEELIPYCIEMSDYYLPNRQFPDKTIDVLDLACAKAKCKGMPLLSKSLIDETMKQVSSYKMPIMKEEQISELMKLVKDQELVQRIILRMKALGEYCNSDALACFWLQAKGDVQRLVSEWIASGYQGKERMMYINGNRLFDNEWWIRRLYRNPFQVVVVEDFSRMCVEAQQMFFQAMERGCIEDSKGKVIDLRHCIFVLWDSLEQRVSSRLYITDVRIEDQMDKISELNVKMLS